MLRIRGPIVRSADTASAQFNMCIFRLNTTSQYLNCDAYKHFSSLTNKVKGSSQVIRDSLVVQQALQNLKRNCT